MKPTDPAREQIDMEIQHAQNRLRVEAIKALLQGRLSVRPVIQDQRGLRQVVWIVTTGDGESQVLNEDGLFDFARQLSELVRR